MTATLTPSNLTETRSLVLSTMLRPVGEIERHVKTYSSTAVAKMIRDTFRKLGWLKFLSVTKGGYSLGTRIEWKRGLWGSEFGGSFGVWMCERRRSEVEAYARGDTSDRHGMCFCTECRQMEAARRAVAVRVSYVLRKMFGESFGDRSDISSDYFDADYTFHP